MTGKVRFTITTSGEFEFDIDDIYQKEMTFEEFKEWLYKYYIWEEDFYTTEERVTEGYITFENGETFVW